MNYKLTIGWLYPRLMSTYGDIGNVIVLKKRCEWRKIEVEILELNEGFSENALSKCDLLFMGGAQDREQQIVSKDMHLKRAALKRLIEDELPGLYICGAYQFLGNYYKDSDGKKIEGLSIMDLHTVNPGQDAQRLIGNIAIEFNEESIGKEKFEKNADSLLLDTMIVGFENHGGRTYLGKGVMPFGKVLVGFGNNGEDKTEGAVYKNSFGTYLHGPILPKNPQFADLLISLALGRKHKEKIVLSLLDNDLEFNAHNAIAKRLGITI